MTYLQMSYILEVGKHLSFAKAARNLYVSQSAISKQVSSFEKEIGLPLFIRSRRRLTVTPEGEKVLALLAKQEHEMQATLRQISKIRRGIRRTIRVGFYPSMFSGDTLGRACAQFRDVYPDLDVEYNCINRDTLIGQAGNFDILLCVESDLRQLQEYESRRLKTLPVNLLVSREHPLAQKETIAYKDFGNVPVFYMEKMKGLNSGVNFSKKSCAASGCPEREHMQYHVPVPDACSMYMNVEAGLGIAFAPYDESLTAGRNLKLYPLPDLLEYVVAMCLPAKLDDELKFFIELLVDKNLESES